jgi:hypothetical protein
MSIRIVFVTHNFGEANSSNIANYDSFVTADAQAAGLGTFNGMTVTWQAIVSVADHSGIVTVNANDPTRLPVTSTVPIYRVDGVNVVSSGVSIWSGQNLNAPIDITETGSFLFIFPWTGTAANGNADAPLTSQIFATSTLGISTSTDSEWVKARFNFSNNQASFYAVSSVLFAPATVPEPSSLALLCVAGGLSGIGYT